MASPIISISVRREKPELVVPSKATPRERKELSDLDDQQFLRCQVPLTMFYENKEDSMKSRDPAKIIKKALAEALVLYYPLAGRLYEGPNRKLMVDCAGQGVLFVEANADVKLEDLGDKILPPSPYLEELLHDVPGSGDILGCPLFLIQVTRFACGGFVFAIRMNHTMLDGFGIVQFLDQVGEFAKSDFTTNIVPSKHPPVWQRHIFIARDPPRITCSHHKFLNDGSNVEMTMDINQDDTLIHKSFFLGPREISVLRSHVSPESGRCSTFEVVAASIWRCRVAAFVLHSSMNSSVRLFLTCNLRGKQLIDIPSGYYGNALVAPIVATDAKTLLNSPLDYAVEFVKKAKSQLMDEDYVPSFVDLLVIMGRPMFLTGVNDFVVTDNTKTGLHQVDFGWGKPIYGGLAMGSFFVSSLCRSKNKDGEDGILVTVSLPLPSMERFQQELEKMTH